MRLRDGRALTWRDVGEGSPLICHPGGPGMSSRYFGVDLAGLAATRRLIMLNPRGTGGSDPSPDGTYSLEGYASDLEEFREHLGLASFDLLGHSHGGFVAQLYASEHGDHLRKLVLCCTAPRFSEELAAEAAATLERFADAPWYDDARAAQRARRAGIYSNMKELRDLYEREFRLWFHDDSDWEAFRPLWAAEIPHGVAMQWHNEHVVPAFDLRTALREVTTPTLVVTAAADFLGPVVSQREFAECLPSATFATIAGAGHFPFAEANAAEPFRNVVEAFLA